MFSFEKLRGKHKGKLPYKEESTLLLKPSRSSEWPLSHRLNSDSSQIFEKSMGKAASPKDLGILGTSHRTTE